MCRNGDFAFVAIKLHAAIAFTLAPMAGATACRTNLCDCWRDLKIVVTKIEETELIKGEVNGDASAKACAIKVKRVKTRKMRKECVFDYVFKRSADVVECEA